MVFKIGPNVFDRIQFRRIRGKPLDQDAALYTSQIFANDAAAMGGQSIPDDEQVTGQVAEQMLKKQDHLLAPDRLFEDLEIEVPQGDTGDDRKGLPVEVMLQDGSLSAGCPSAAAMGTPAQPAFVDEDDRTPLFAGCFLMAGQRFFFQSSMAASFRSTARPTGNCGLQFNFRRIFHTWPRW